MLSYDAVGAGERTMVFLHGFGGSRGLWRQQMEEFSPVARCLALDLPGHGESAWSPLELSEMAGQVIVVLRRERVGQAHVVANSFGGLVALEIWRHAPELFSAVTFAGSLPRFTECADFPAGLNVAKIRKLAGQFEGDVEQVLDMFFRSLFTATERNDAQYAKIKDLRRAARLPEREALRVMLDILEETDFRNLYKTISVPLQIINGDQDYICPLAAVEALRLINPLARVCIFKDCGHFPFLSYPQKFNRVVKGFAGL